MTMKILLIATAFIVTSIESFGQYCTTNSRFTEVPFFDSTEISVGSNVQFGTALDHLGKSYALKMDLYYPNLNIDVSPKRPFIMLFHGGGFSSGDKQSGDIKDLCFHLARRGFVCASVNYRIGSDFTEFGQYKARYRAIQDGHAAMRYAVNNANSVRIDTNWIFVGGQSAGSLLALGMVYADQIELDSISLLYNTQSTSVQLGNLYSSGNNLTNNYSIKGIFNNWGGVSENEIDVEEMLPTVAFHGAKDTTVLIDADNSFLHYTLNGSKAIHNKLIKNKICSEITIDTAGGHGIFRNASSVLRAGRASCFFKSIFCKNCSDFYTTDSVTSNCSRASSIKNKTATEFVKIYPNPFENTFKISGIEGAFTITIYNCLGQTIYHKENSNNNVNVNFPAGAYLLSIKQIESKKTFHLKLIKN